MKSGVLIERRTLFKNGICIRSKRSIYLVPHTGIELVAMLRTSESSCCIRDAQQSILVLLVRAFTEPVACSAFSTVVRKISLKGEEEEVTPR
ncbi:hypothetical protein JTB14_038346 [Gonioctena quinquepunctata]|nr:hypothetical protein JTB14_038346 [Gonioctena quinquepunctata]